jgi:prephenate dehydrogenase
MWAAIFDMNRPALLTALDAFESDLAEFRSAIETADVEACRGLIDSARKLRLELK